MIDLTLQPQAEIFPLRFPALPRVVRHCLPDVLGILFLAFFALLAYAHYGDVSGAMDVQIYQGIAMRADEVMQGARDHVGSEYPPLATTLFWIANSLTSGTDFAAAWLTAIVMAVCCAWAYLRCFHARDAMLLALILPLSVLMLGHDMVFARYDIFVCLMLILSARAHAHQSYAESAAWLGVAVGLKIVPVLAIPLLLLATPRRHWTSLAFGLISATAIGVTLSFGVLGIDGIIDNIQYLSEYHSGRLVQLESMWSGLTMLQALALGRVIHSGFDHMSYFNLDVSQHVILLAKFFVLGGLGALLLRLRIIKSSRNFGVLLSVILLWALAMSPVLSPQYFTWVVPLVFIVILGRFLEGIITPRGVCAIGLTILIAYLTQWIFPAHYHDLTGQRGLAMIMLNIRNISILFLTYFLLTDDGIIPPLHQCIPLRFFAHTKESFLTDSILACVGLFIVIAVHPMLVVKLQEVVFFTHGAQEIAERLPISRLQDSDTMIVTTSLFVPELAQHRFFRVRPDDCVESIVVNGAVMPAHLTQFCDGVGPGRIFDFGLYLKTGLNSVAVTIRNSGGSIGMDLIASVTSLLFVTLVALSLLFLWYLSQCYCLYCAFRHSPYSAHMAGMLYNRAALWNRSHTPAQTSSMLSVDGQVTLST